VAIDGSLSPAAQTVSTRVIAAIGAVPGRAPVKKS
jgi:hypothetical protein